ncbi:lipopolysaccharide biosynthesis protein [Clostridium cibarium]|uniref:Oligosaccharide flippase family protein n=1 Tax=Clostridium cibarium TaxID=2762247 RepID=A0ABR8PUD0_9CLOT|nr:oligosaccharide flippase family protein [Clostridium cibarium]MBD7911776.1 oligosaccharide flippase family protein [Clostridium cibarium]
MKKGSLIRSFMSYALGSGITLIIGFFSSPVITRLINPEEYGKFSMFTLVANIAMLAIICGLDQSFVRFFYEEKEKLRPKLLQQSLIIPFILNVVIAVGMLVFYKKLALVFFQSESFFIMIFIIINNTIMLINRFAFLIIRMEQKSRSYSILQVIQKLSYIIGVIVLATPLNKSYLTLVIATVFSNLLSTIIAILLDMKYWRVSSYKKEMLKNDQKVLIAYGIPLVFSGAVTWIFQYVDRIAIKQFSGYEELGVYGAAFSIVALLNAVQSTFTTFWTPVALEKYIENRENKQFFSNMCQYISVAMLYMGIGLILFKDIVVYLLGAEYRSASFIMPFLIFMPIMYTVSETTVIGINFSKKPNYHILISVASCLLNVIGNLILVPMLGAKGAAISTGISYILFYVLRTHISLKFYYVNYKLREFYICIFIIASYALYSTFNKANFFTILFGILSIVIVTVLYKEILRKVYDILKKKFDKQ